MGLLALVILLVCGVSRGKTDDCECEDVAPEVFSCDQQKYWGKCDAPWMIQFNYCQKTCERCSCTDVGVQDVTQSAENQLAYQADAIAKLEQLMDSQQQQQSADDLIQPEDEIIQNNGGQQLDAYQEYLLDKLGNFSEEQLLQQQKFETPSNEQQIQQIQQTPSEEQKQQQYEVQLVAPSTELLPQLSLRVEEDDVPNLGVEIGFGNATVSGESETKIAAKVIPSPSMDAPMPNIPMPQTTNNTSIQIDTEDKDIISTGPAEASVSSDVVREVKVPADNNPLLGIQKPCTPLSSILQGSPGLQQFKRLLRLVDYSIENHDKNITLFAPIDQGVTNFLRDYDLKINDLDKLDSESLKTLQTKLQPFVKYHFVDQIIKSDAVERFKKIQLPTHFQEKLLFVRDLRSSQPAFELIDGQGDKCNVMIPDLEACEGVVHMVACMLRPDL